VLPVSLGLAFHDIGAYGFWSMIIFLGVLTIVSSTNGKRERWNGIERRSLVAPVRVYLVPTGKLRRNDPFFGSVSDQLADKGFLVTPPTISSNGRARAR